MLSIFGLVPAQRSGTFPFLKEWEIGNDEEVDDLNGRCAQELVEIHKRLDPHFFCSANEGSRCETISI